jgi:hypothetical protein
MDESLRQKVVWEAQELWRAGRALEAGKLIFERIPIENLAEWSANILEIALEYFPPSPDIEAVLEFAKHPDGFGKGIDGKSREAHAIVDKVNRFPYLRPEPFPQVIFTLATNVGKVVYNVQGYHAPFDYDAGWEIVATFLQIAQGVNDPEFEAKAWSVLCAEKYLKLETPMTDPLFYPEWFVKHRKQTK